MTARLALLAVALHALAAWAQGPTAAFVEIADKWTSAVGLGDALGRAGFTPAPVGLDAGLPRADVLVIGSFATEAPEYRAWAARNADGVREMLRRGGIVVELTQADQTAQAPPFLPDGLAVARTDLDAGPVVVLDTEHPLLAALPRLPDATDAPERLALPTHFGRTGSWETWAEQEGFRVLAGAGAIPSASPVVLEAAVGRGRLILCSLYFDKLARPDGAAVATPAFAAASDAFFLSLRRYAELVAAGQAPDVIPTPPYTPPAPFEYVEGSMTLAVLPDTQVYAQSYPDTFVAQTRWIRENVDTNNIAFVLHAGDITNTNTAEQWDNAKRAFMELDGLVPYALAIGNHDCGPGGSARTRDTLINDYFPISQFRDLPTFGGAFEPHTIDNTFHLFEAGGYRWIAIALEWGPRDEVVAWLDRVLTDHADRVAIIITHAYMFNDDTRYAWRDGKRQSWNPHGYGTASLPGGVNDGEDLWQKAIRRHGNVAMVLSGHVLGDGTGLLSSTGDKGNTVHQMLANFQMRRGGGEGYMRLIELLPDGRTIQVRTWSPLLQRSLTEADQQFRLQLDVRLEAPR